ncbi:M23 family metallopeptidase [Paenibacillus sp. GSMTC-2017]|uniref:M23 family metallopeptidase n=1 Tax=Paenibacillus sp. GSMTC-2017 TaxID=2794350 RepID=UPI0018D5ECFB|nr:M23 family metallopeptidase [Paenibacillus sp. GSMTC-2017]MBH5316468.1 M23 family metallopeptidase [Paenibacillus sp. GSMTC-2017]
MSIKIAMPRVILALLFTILTLCWISILGNGGVSAVASWWFLIGFGVIGCLLFILSLSMLAGNVRRRTRIRKSWIITLFLSVIAIWPLGWIFDVGKIAFPLRVEVATPAATVRFPLIQPTIVSSGGDKLKNNHHAVWPMERWAYDLLMEPVSVGSTELDDYGIYGAEVVAPSAGEIIDVYDEEQDGVPGTENFETMLGNYVYLHMDETDTYLVLSHLKQRSIVVKAGQRVKEGELLGQVGNSGASSEPHLHIHHQRQNPTTTHMFLTEGLPLYFRNIYGPAMPVGGNTKVDGKNIPTGDRITPL